jgi:transcription initiation factor TFIIE subunit beta
MRVQDLAIITNTPLDTDPVLLQRFRDHDRIVCLPGNKDLFEYKVELWRGSRLHWL